MSSLNNQWLADGKKISLKNVATYFGPASIKVVSQLAKGRITAEISCPGDRRPRTVSIRLPHPDGLIPTRVEGGKFDPKTETVRITNFQGAASVVLEWAAK